MTGCTPDPTNPPSPAPINNPNNPNNLPNNPPNNHPNSPNPNNPENDIIIDKMQHLASFLLIRGPYAWIGWSWLGINKITDLSKITLQITLTNNPY